MIPGIGLWILLSVACCVHIVRTNQATFWLWIVLFFPWLGALVYGVVVVLPGIFGGPTARKMGQAARETLDPTREYREAKAACEATPTVHNRMRLGKAAAAMGRHDEAEQLYREAATGIHAEDPVLILGRAQALVELGRNAEGLDLLHKLDPANERIRTPAAVLAMARAYEGLGRISEADASYEQASERMPGLEAVARRAAFLARHGRKDEAHEMLADIDRRLAAASAPFRREGRPWRDLAARALAGS
jgi:hypothetical protein